MKFYSGRNDKDPPLGGGEFVNSEGYCGEECNFYPCDDGYTYGHFETIKGEIDRQVMIERLGARTTDQFVDGVDIVWTAPIEGRDPRVVVGWWRNARLYRWRQTFNGNFPSPRHRKDEITSFRARARSSEVVLLEPSRRTMKLGRGPGWSGQASWWYADYTTDSKAIEFVAEVKSAINGHPSSSSDASSGQGRNGRNGRAGQAPSEIYERYVREYEIKINPKHDRLQEKFKKFLKKQYPGVKFLTTYRDDLRFYIKGQSMVMVEVKPTDPTTLRFAIRMAIGQLLDYKQHQRWSEKQLIVVETEVTNADDLELALGNGFGLAWPDDNGGFKISWPA